ncbi:hypothetical protein F4805DRAFT_463012 [Annulohypoxylon moriforme]|nr:hypothetical protein F4805DRAFT_463012 [Annulohypoxylon moriforme]
MATLHEEFAALDLNSPDDQVVDATMDNSQQSTPHQGICAILSSEITYQGTIRIRRSGSEGQVLLVRLLESFDDEDFYENPPFHSIYLAVLDDISFRLYYPRTLDNVMIVPPLQENMDILLRACGYMLAKKNRMYLEFRKQFAGGVFATNEPARYESAAESGTFMSEVARAELKPKSQECLKVVCEGTKLDLRLLFARYHPLSGNFELYNNESGCLGSYSKDVQDIVLWESEEALDTLYFWIKCLNAQAGTHSLGAYHPESEKNKRKRGHEDLEPEPKRGRIEPEVEDRDEVMDSDMTDGWRKLIISS